MIGHDYPYLDTKDLNLDWLLKNMKSVLEQWAEYKAEMNQSFADLEEANAAFKRDVTTAFNELHDFVDDYFDNLDVQQEINNKLDSMKLTGELAEIMNPLVASETADWLAEHITNPSNPPIDTSLSVSGAAADAKVVGDILTDLKNQISGIIKLESGTFSDNDGVTKIISPYRLRNINPIIVKEIFEITMPAGYNVWWYALNDNMVSLGNSTNWANTVDVSNLPADTVFINIAIRNQSTPSSDISSQRAAVEAGITTLYIDEKALNVAEKTDKAFFKFANLFNPQAVHDGIQSQTNGATYGTITASSDYCFTELIPLDGIEKLCVFNNFIGNSTVYVTFFGADKTVVDKANGYNITITSFPVTAVYFCVTVGKAYLQTCMIYPEYHAEYIPYGRRVDDIYGYAKYQYKRLDRVFFTDYQANSVNTGASPFPYKTGSGIYISALIKVPSAGVSYRKAESFTPRVFYATSANAIISYEDCTSMTGTLTIPVNAEYLYYLGGTNSGARDPEQAFCIVEGSTVPSEIYRFDDIKIDGLEIETEDYLIDKSIVFDGDSITEGAGVTDISTGIAPNNNKGWGYWIQRDHPGSICYGYGKSGWKVGRIENETDSLLNHIASYPQNVDLFVLSGGYNDQAVQMAMGELVEVTDGANAYFNATFDQYTFIGALEYWFQQLRMIYPNAQIVYIITPKRVYTTNPVFNNDTKGVRVKDVLYSTGKERIDLFWEKIRTVCDKWAVKFLDLSKNSGIVGTGETTGNGLTVNSRYFQITDGVPDFTHPNTLYYTQFIVPQVEALIKSVIS